MIWGMMGPARDLSRLHEITSVLIRHGLGDLVRRAGVGSVLERAGQILHWGESAELAHLEPQQRIRLAMEKLGPTFVKLGQLLSTREDLFTPEWIEEFEKLQSEVAPVPFESLLPEVQAALEASPLDVFDELETPPLASGSIAQVHRARLKNGTRVVLKIRRPGIKQVVEADLRILSYVAGLLDSEVEEARRYQPKEILAQFANSLERELDLAMEARNQDRFANNFRDDTRIMVPKIYWEWTSPVMNVQEYIEAIPGNDREAIDAAGLDRKALARRGAEAVLKMILVDGFFHADPHPGNVFYLPGNRLVLIDHGMVGRLTRARRHQIVDLLFGVARRDEEAMLDVVMEWTGGADVDESRLASDLGELLYDYADAPIKDLHIAVLLRKITGIVRKHSIVLPPDLALLFKCLITLEGSALQYDPEFRLTNHLAPLLERAAAERYEPKTIINRGRHSIGEIYNLMTTVPKDLARVIREMRRGRMRVDLDMKRLDTFGKQLDESIDRITVGIMTASLVIGSSIVMTVSGGPQILGVPLLIWLGLLGYLIAFCNSVWIIASIWRSRRNQRRLQDK